MSKKIGRPFWSKYALAFKNWMHAQCARPRQPVRAPDMKRGKPRERTKRTNQQ